VWLYRALVDGEIDRSEARAARTGSRQGLEGCGRADQPTRPSPRLIGAGQHREAADQTRPSIPALCAADAVILVDADDLGAQRAQALRNRLIFLMSQSQFCEGFFNTPLNARAPATRPLSVAGSTTAGSGWAGMYRISESKIP